MAVPSEEDRWELAWCQQNHRWYYRNRQLGASSWTRPDGCELDLPDSSQQSRRRGRCTWSCGRCLRRSATSRALQKDDMQLPDGWQAGWDSKHGSVYFYNKTTKESCWTKPAKDDYCDGQYVVGGSASSTAVPGSERTSISPASRDVHDVEDVEGQSSSTARKDKAGMDLEAIQVVVDDRYECHPRSSPTVAKALDNPLEQDHLTVEFQPGPIGFYSKDGYTVEQVADGGQAHHQGVQVGWRIVAVDNRSCASFRDKIFQDARKGNIPFSVAFAKEPQFADEDEFKECCQCPDSERASLPRKAAENIACFLGHAPASSSRNEESSQSHSLEQGRFERENVANVGCFRGMANANEVALSDARDVRSNRSNSPCRSEVSWRTVHSICTSIASAKMSASVSESLKALSDARVATNSQEVLRPSFLSFAGASDARVPMNGQEVLSLPRPSSLDFQGNFAEEIREIAVESGTLRAVSPCGSESSWQSALNSPQKSVRGESTPQLSEISGPQCSERSYFTGISKEPSNMDCNESWKSFSSKRSSTLELSDLSWQLPVESRGESCAKSDACVESKSPNSPSRASFGALVGMLASAASSAASLLSPSNRTKVKLDTANLNSTKDASPEQESAIKSPKGKAKGKGKGKGKATPPPPPKAGGKPDGSPSKGKGGSKGRSPRKPAIVPKVSLKKIFWNPICLDESQQMNANAELNVWEKIHQRGVSIDEGELEVLFSDEPRPTDGSLGEIHPSRPTRRITATSANSRRLLSEARRRQIWCMLSLLPEWDQLQKAIANMDDEVLTQENVDLLSTNLPTAAEEGLLRTALKDPLKHDEAWDAPEDFLIRLTATSTNALHIRIWNFLNSFGVNCTRLQQAQDDLAKACSALRDSPRIEKLLAVILYTGNYLNGGTSRGRADGFDIDTLLKISKLKAVQKELNGTLLDFVVKQVEQEDPGMLSGMFASGMEKDLVHCARKHMSVELADEVARLLAQAETHLSKWSDDEGMDATQIKRKAELTESIDKLRQLGESFANLQLQYGKLCTWFQMNLAKPRPTDEFFGIWSTFLEDVGKSLDALQKKQKSLTLPRRPSRSSTPQRQLASDSTPTCGPSRRQSTLSFAGRQDACRPVVSPRDCVMGNSLRRSRPSLRDPLQHKRRRPLTPRSGVGQRCNSDSMDCVDVAKDGAETSCNNDSAFVDTNVDQTCSSDSINCVDAAKVGVEINCNNDSTYDVDARVDQRRGSESIKGEGASVGQRLTSDSIDIADDGASVDQRRGSDSTEGEGTSSEQRLKGESIASVDTSVGQRLTNDSIDIADVDASQRRGSDSIEVEGTSGGQRLKGDSIASVDTSVGQRLTSDSIDTADFDASVDQRRGSDSIEVEGTSGGQRLTSDSIDTADGVACPTET